MPAELLVGAMTPQGWRSTVRNCTSDTDLALTMTNVQLHRHYRRRLVVPVALLVSSALFAVWEIDTLAGVLMEPMSAFILGVILGAMTGLGLVVRQRWRLYLASRT